jgi:hypothetical protein
MFLWNCSWAFCVRSSLRRRQLAGGAVLAARAKIARREGCFPEIVLPIPCGSRMQALWMLLSRLAAGLAQRFAFLVILFLEI